MENSRTRVDQLPTRARLDFGSIGAMECAGSHEGGLRNKVQFLQPRVTFQLPPKRHDVNQAS